MLCGATRRPRGSVPPPAATPRRPGAGGRPPLPGAGSHRSFNPAQVAAHAQPRHPCRLPPARQGRGRRAFRPRGGRDRRPRRLWGGDGGGCHATAARGVSAGTEIVSDDGTAGNSHAPYVEDRSTGVSGKSPRDAPADLDLSPTVSGRSAGEGGTPGYPRPVFGGDLRSKGQGAPSGDIARLKAAIGDPGPDRGDCERGFARRDRALPAERPI